MLASFEVSSTLAAILPTPIYVPDGHLRLLVCWTSRRSTLSQHLVDLLVALAERG